MRRCKPRGWRRCLFERAVEAQVGRAGMPESAGGNLARLAGNTLLAASGAAQASRQAGEALAVASQPEGEGGQQIVPTPANRRTLAARYALQQSCLASPAPGRCAGPPATASASNIRTTQHLSCGVCLRLPCAGLLSTSSLRLSAYVLPAALPASAHPASLSSRTLARSTLAQTSAFQSWTISSASCRAPRRLYWPTRSCGG